MRDVDLDHPWVKKYRLPVSEVATNKCYFMELRLPPTEDNKWNGLAMPTEEEAALLGSYLEYRIDRYGFYEHIIKQMREKPLDTDSLVNTVTFYKYKNDAWRYQMLTWQHGAWPFFNAEKQYYSLMELLDKIEVFCDEPNAEWIQWKINHKLV